VAKFNLSQELPLVEMVARSHFLLVLALSVLAETSRLLPVIHPQIP
jgi:hypothetical protein